MKILPVRTCFNCGHCFDAKLDEESELCPLCLKETDSLFEDFEEIDFHDMYDEVDTALGDMLYD